MKKIFTLLLLAGFATALTSCGQSPDDVDVNPVPPAQEKEMNEEETTPEEISGPADVGHTVSVHYVGTLDDGEEFDSSRQEGRSPLTFTIGDGSMIAGFDAGVQGMSVGETKNIRIEAADAYGEEIVEQEIARDVIQDLAGEDVELVVGNEYTPEGKPPFTVVSMDENNVTISFENAHNLAGKALNFEIELLSVTK